MKTYRTTLNPIIVPLLVMIVFGSVFFLFCGKRRRKNAACHFNFLGRDFLFNPLDAF